MSCPKPTGAGAPLAPMIVKMLDDEQLTDAEARRLKAAGAKATKEAIAGGESAFQAKREVMDAYLIAVADPMKNAKTRQVASYLGITSGAKLSDLADTAKTREYREAMVGVTAVRRSVDEIVKGTSTGRQLRKQLNLSAADVAALKAMPKPKIGLFEQNPTQHELEDAKTRAWIKDTGSRIEVQIPNRGHDHLEKLTPVLDKIANGLETKKGASAMGYHSPLQPEWTRWLKKEHGCCSGADCANDHDMSGGPMYSTGKLPSLKGSAVVSGDVPKSAPMPLPIEEWNGKTGMGDHHLQWHIDSRDPRKMPPEQKGLRFLAMHHLMLNMYRSAPWADPKHRAECAKEAAPLFAGWPANKPPLDVQNDPTYGPAVKVMMNITDKKNLDLFADDKAFGNWLETQAGPIINKVLVSGAHNAMHVKYMDPQNAQTPIDMGDPSKNINNQLFFQLHGWIDNVWNAFHAAKQHELAGDPIALGKLNSDYDSAFKLEQAGWDKMMGGKMQM